MGLQNKACSRGLWADTDGESTILATVANNAWMTRWGTSNIPGLLALVNKNNPKHWVCNTHSVNPFAFIPPAFSSSAPRLVCQPHMDPLNLCAHRGSRRAGGCDSWHLTAKQLSSSQLHTAASQPAPLPLWDTGLQDVPFFLQESLLYHYFTPTHHLQVSCSFKTLRRLYTPLGITNKSPITMHIERKRVMSLCIYIYICNVWTQRAVNCIYRWYTGACKRLKSRTIHKPVTDTNEFSTPQKPIVFPIYYTINMKSIILCILAKERR